MYRSMIVNKQNEVLFYRDSETFEESLQDLNNEINNVKGVPLSHASIYKRRDPNIPSSGIMIASLRIVR